MRKRIYPVLLALLIPVAALYVINDVLWRGFTRGQETVQKSETIDFIGNGKGSYHFGDACAAGDSLIYLASGFSSGSLMLDYVSLCKLTSEGVFLSEKRTRINGFHIRNLLPANLVSKHRKPQFEVRNLSFHDGKLFLLVLSHNKKGRIPQILEFDEDCNPIKRHKTDLVLDANSEPVTLLQNGFAYIGYIEKQDKALRLAMIEAKAGKIIYNKVKFYKQPTLEMVSITSDSADTAAFFVARDREKNITSFYKTTPNDVREVFRTADNTEITLLKFIDDKLYGIVKEDSSLVIADFTDTEKPMIYSRTTVNLNRFWVNDLVFHDGNAFLPVTFVSEKAKRTDTDAMILCIKPSASTARKILMQSTGNERTARLFRTSAEELLALGSYTISEAHGINRIFRVKYRFAPEHVEYQ